MHSRGDRFINEIITTLWSDNQLQRQIWKLLHTQKTQSASPPWGSREGSLSKAEDILDGVEVSLPKPNKAKTTNQKQNETSKKQDLLKFQTTQIQNHS